MTNVDDNPLQYSSRKPLRGVLGVMRQGLSVLMIQRSQHVRAPLTWCFPGGKIENGETQPEALIREMREELNLVVDPGELLMTQTKHSGRLILYCWSAIHRSGVPRPNPAEVADLAWMTRDQVAARPDVLPGTLEILDAVLNSH